MPPQLPADCINEILECLEDDKLTLRSCLLVNRLWCEIAVKILWGNIHNYSTSNIRTLITCLPNESKEILRRSEIIIPTPTSKPPMFNYAAFCKVLSINHVNYKVSQLLQSQNLNDNRNTVTQEMHKLFMKQISSLKTLSFFQNHLVTFTTYPGAEDCLKNLSKLSCYSNNCPEFFYQLSQICHNIQTLYIEFRDVVSNGLTDLISVQKNLKHLDLSQYIYCKN